MREYYQALDENAVWCPTGPPTSIAATTEFGGDIDWKISFDVSLPPQARIARIKFQCRGVRAWLALHYYLTVPGLSWGQSQGKDRSSIWFVLGGTGTRLLFGSAAQAACRFGTYYQVELTTAAGE